MKLATNFRLMIAAIAFANSTAHSHAPVHKDVRGTSTRSEEGVRGLTVLSPWRGNREDWERIAEHMCKESPQNCHRNLLWYKWKLSDPEFRRSLSSSTSQAQNLVIVIPKDIIARYSNAKSNNNGRKLVRNAKKRDLQTSNPFFLPSYNSRPRGAQRYLLDESTSIDNELMSEFEALCGNGECEAILCPVETSSKVEALIEPCSVFELDSLPEFDFMDEPSVTQEHGGFRKLSRDGRGRALRDGQKLADKEPCDQEDGTSRKNLRGSLEAYR